MTLEKSISRGSRYYAMFVHYPDASTQLRHFDSARVCAAWQRTMTLMQSIGAVVKFHTFPLASLPKGIKVTR